jgi:hypothetical protein
VCHRVARKIAQIFFTPFAQRANAFALAFPKTVHEDRAFPPSLILIFLILIFLILIFLILIFLILIFLILIFSPPWIPLFQRSDSLPRLAFASSMLRISLAGRPCT